ncbi:hypothetical protein D0S45_03550 [Marinifilum sp. JC120]|nr:hypothetical protein D0S45_03550 [Marinifilum sp. JC120]
MKLQFLLLQNSQQEFIAGGLIFHDGHFLRDLGVCPAIIYMHRRRRVGSPPIFFYRQGEGDRNDQKAGLYGPTKILNALDNIYKWGGKRSGGEPICSID